MQRRHGRHLAAERREGSPGPDRCEADPEDDHGSGQGPALERRSADENAATFGLVVVEHRERPQPRPREARRLAAWMPLPRQGWPGPPRALLTASMSTLPTSSPCLWWSRLWFPCVAGQVGRLRDQFRRLQGRRDLWAHSVGRQVVQDPPGGAVLSALYQFLAVNDRGVMRPLPRLRAAAHRALHRLPRYVCCGVRLTTSASRVSRRRCRWRLSLLLGAGVNKTGS